METHSNILQGKWHGERSLVDFNLCIIKESNTTEWLSMHAHRNFTFLKSLKPTLFILSHNIFSKYWKVFRLSFIWIVFKMGAVWKKPRWNYLKSSFPLSSIKCHLEYILNILFLMDLPPKEVTRPFIEYEMSQQVETIFLAFSSVSSTFLCERL